MDNNTIYVSNVEILDDMVVLIPNRDIRVLINCGCYGLVICCGATAASNLPVAKKIYLFYVKQEILCMQIN